jgi:hypothetical protein
MKEQIRELQSQVKDLEARLNGVTGTASHTTIDRSATVIRPVEIESPPTEEPLEKNPAPSVKLRIFGGVGYEVSDQKGATNTFYVGTLALFMTGTLTDRVSVLGEVLFTPNADNSFGIDVERILLQCKQNDYLNLSIRALSLIHRLLQYRVSPRSLVSDHRGPPLNV